MPVGNFGESVGAGQDAAVRAQETSEALAILQRMDEFLGSQARISLSAEIGFEVVQADGQKIEFGGTRRVDVRRPDRIRLESRSRDGEIRFIYINDRRVTGAIPQKNLYSSVEGPSSLVSAIDFLVDEVGIPVPLADLLQPNFYEEVSASVESGALVGEEWMDGTLCDHLAFRGANVDFQIWVSSGASPLPRRVVINYRNEEGVPQFWARYQHWNLAPSLPDELFQFTPPPGATRVSFEELLGRASDGPGGENDE